jgi:hypothetical protein
MTKGPNRKILDDYLDTALGGHLQVVGDDWKRKAQDLRTLSSALKLAAGQAELRIGEQSLSGPALRAGMEKSATSMVEKSDMLRAAGDALVTVGQQINDTKDARDAMADIGPRPAAYQAPTNTTGVETTPEELHAQAQAAQARQAEINAWQTQYDKQEARSLTLTKQLDAAFIGAIPPMKEIHGQKDPTEPTDDVPSGPGGPYLPGTQAPPPTGGGGGGGKNAQGFFVDSWIEHGSEVTTTNTTTTNPTNPTNPTLPPTQPPTQPPTHPISPLLPTETTTVTGSQQSGVTYQGPQVSAPTSTGGAGGAGGMNAAAFGAAGAAGGASGMMGGVRAGSAPASAGSAPTRQIGATGRSGSAGALSRTPGATTGSAAGRGATAGSPTSRGAAGSAGARGAAGTAGSAGGRGGAGSAGSRGAASGSTAGSRAGGRGSSGARSAGAGASAGRGGRKGERDESQQRDSLVYDQDWLGDDDVAPGVLD